MAASCTGGTLKPRKGVGLSEPHRKQTKAPHLLHGNNFEVHRLYKRRTKCVDGELDRVVTRLVVFGEPLGHHRATGKCEDRLTESRACLSESGVDPVFQFVLSTWGGLQGF